jgi:Raf kinase inhibitor-like YbhB/YbcL family protein
MSVMRYAGAIVLAGGFALATICGASAAGPFTLTSPAFKDSMPLAVKNAGNFKANPNCIGENVSPPLAWANPPEGTKSYALVIFDPEGRNGLTFVHLVAYGIPASVTSFAENELSKPGSKFVGGTNGFKLGYYMGPCTPPNTDMHHYFFLMIATDLEPTALSPGLTYEQLVEKLAGHAKGAASLVGLFKKPN